MADDRAIVSTPHPRPYRDATAKAPRGVAAGRYAAELSTDDDAVVFVIGMRVNRWRKVRSWLPIFVAMPRMLRELQAEPDGPLLGARTYWSGRVFMTVQYWRSPAELGAYARDGARRHAPAWARFNRTAAATADVGIFHETYRVGPDDVESAYNNTPAIGLAAAHRAVPHRSRRSSATARRVRGGVPEPDTRAG